MKKFAMFFICALALAAFSVPALADNVVLVAGNGFVSVPVAGAPNGCLTVGYGLPVVVTAEPIVRVSVTGTVVAGGTAVVTQMAPVAVATPVAVAEPVVVSAPCAVPVAPVAVAPSWMCKGNFDDVAKWGANRMAMLVKPRTPFVWSTERPDLLYVWTGKSWYRINVMQGENVAGALERNMYEIVRMTKTAKLDWNDAETPWLASVATSWNMLWCGIVVPSDLRDGARPFSGR